MESKKLTQIDGILAFDDDNNDEVYKPFKVLPTLNYNHITNKALTHELRA